MAVIPAAAYLVALSGLYALHIIEFLVKLLILLASTMLCVLRFCDDGYQGLFFYKEVKFQTCYLFHTTLTSS